MTSPLMIAIVDDDPSVRRALHRLVQAAGYIASTFASAHEFLDSLPRGRPACLILDIHLDGMSGLDLHDRLWADGAAVPTIFVSAHDTAPTRERIARAAGASHLWKPVDEQALLDAIRQAVAPGEGPPGTPDGPASPRAAMLAGSSPSPRAVPRASTSKEKPP